MGNQLMGQWGGTLGASFVCLVSETLKQNPIYKPRRNPHIYIYIYICIYTFIFTMTTYAAAAFDSRELPLDSREHSVL